MNKILTYLSFIIAVTGLVVLMLTATSYIQLVVATLFYPPIAYFLLKNSPVGKKNDQNNESKEIATAKGTNTDAELVTIPATENVVDSEKRAFLKLIGSVGLSLFLFSIFTRRSEALFFGKAVEGGSTGLEDSEGNKVNPAERQPTDGYQITEIDEGDSIYCGFTNKTGNWFIMKQDLENGSFRYVRGENDFPQNWNKRETFNYDYYYKVFTA